MTDTALIVVGLVIGLELAGLVVLGWMMRDVARMQRALDGLVYQEHEKTRAVVRDSSRS